MFGSMFRDLDDDPFFRDMHETNRRHMQGMGMQSMMFNPMMPSPFMAIEGGSGSRQHLQREQNALQPYGMSDPFNMGFGSMFGNMHNMMANMHQNFDGMASNPNGHSYSQSSYTSYSSDGQGAPKVYQATSSTRQAPGGVKETRRSMRDSEAGLQKMAIGHHLSERAHVVERSRNTHTDHTEEKQDFVNLDEADAPSFNNEWRQRTQQFDRHNAVGGRQRHNTPAITDGRYEHDSLRRDRSPTRPNGPNPGGRHRTHRDQRDNRDRRTETDRKY